MRIHRVIHISSEVDVVWTLISDMDHVRQWSAYVQDASMDEAQPLAPGHRSVTKVEFRGRVIPFESEVTCLEPTERLGFSLRGGPLGPAALHVDYRLSPHGSNGVRLDYTSEWLPTNPLLRIISPLAGFLVGRVVASELDALKSLAESRSRDT